MKMTKWFVALGFLFGMFHEVSAMELRNGKRLLEADVLSGLISSSRKRHRAISNEREFNINQGVKNFIEDKALPQHDRNLNKKVSQLIQRSYMRGGGRGFFNRSRTATSGNLYRQKYGICTHERVTQAVGYCLEEYFLSRGTCAYKLERHKNIQKISIKISR
ncbi:hypothetical protein KBC04_01255 [Candidatus Babeliales bacterium]|nr:hypothetical protein [Candidatus Babeliales bacterium]MBP9843646.1 hypothetical protein [Candidatus Babeliales bacterium]